MGRAAEENIWFPTPESALDSKARLYQEEQNDYYYQGQG